MDAPFPFDAVLFDLDGTLLATERFWLPAARVGARRAFEELGLDRDLPSAEEWMSLVGLPIKQGFRDLFADLAPEQADLVLERCTEEEHFAMTSGGAALLPGVAETLTALAARGVAMGIASNCYQGYLDTALETVGLSSWIGQARCLESPGIRDKAGMIADLLETFGTQSAVMVGDRAADRDAAHANGLPHVHLANGFAPRGESVECEAVIGDFGELEAVLGGRTRWIEAALAAVGFEGEHGPRSVGITSREGAGRALFARDVARLLASRGRPTRLLVGERPPRGRSPAVHFADPARAPLDGETLLAEVLEPHGRGEAVRCGPTATTGAIELRPEETCVVEGPFLTHPRLRAGLERLIVLEAEEDYRLRRVAARVDDPQVLEWVRRDLLEAERACDRAHPPARVADLVLRADNALGGAI
ncbi:MAG: HAD hydrolase-like protein [Planctomycetota bacterium]|jgi:phosphoglycolate phosphatase|nr:HAD hydrolase-like protein [Planctomycetota bacterium]MDP6761347.1 HAD hydrolase-like protein [Planctomycetota bacterium]MDP6990842.1 HAD hydrolase-like protein [Planctomycetota bacterium]